MHRKISSRLALEIILFLAVLVGGFAIVKTSLIKMENYNYASTASSKKAKESEQCRVHAYQGEAKISGWYVKSENDEWVFAVSDDDMAKLPKYDGTEEYKTKNRHIKLVDVTPAMEKTLEKTSEKKPQAITITGYATRCEGIPLAFASLEYKDGIFREYLNLN